MGQVSRRVTFQRAVKAWEPNPNNGILYHGLEDTIHQAILNMQPLFVQLGQDLSTDNIVDRMTVKSHKAAGTLVSVDEISAVVDLQLGDLGNEVTDSVDNYRVYFNYSVDDPKDPMSKVRLMKVVLAKTLRMGYNYEDRKSRPT